MIQQKVRKKKKICFSAHFRYSQSKVMGLNKMWLLKCLAMLICERRAGLYAVQYN